MIRRPGPPVGRSRCPPKLLFPFRRYSDLRLSEEGSSRIKNGLRQRD